MSSSVLRLCLSALLLTIALGCASPTQMTLDLRTDVPCRELESVALSVAPSAAEAESKPPVLVTSACTTSDDDMNVIGTYALIPKNGSSSVAVRVVLATRGYSAESDCTAAKGYKGCIVARRTLDFVSRHQLKIPVDLLLVCEGVSCDESSTCDRLGRCTSAVVDTETSCERNECAQPVTPDASVPIARESRSTWSSSATEVPADGVASTTMTLTLLDGRGAPVVDQQVLLLATGSGNRWATSASHTNDAGVFVAQLSSTTAEAKVVSARTEDVVLSTEVKFVVPVDAGVPDAG